MPRDLESDFENALEYDLSDNPTLESVAVLIGEELATKLSCDFGGVRLHIPVKPGKYSPISVSIGIKAAQIVAEIYGGMRMQVPISAGKREKIQKLLDEGTLSIPKIAIASKCTERNVYKVKAQGLKPPASIPLFED